MRMASIPAGAEPFGQGTLQRGAGKAAIVTDRNGAAIPARDKATEAAADGVGVRFRESSADGATDVAGISRSVVGWKVWVQLISAELHVVAEETTHGVGQIGALQGVGDLGFQEAGLVTAVEAFAFVAQAMERLLAD